MGILWIAVASFLLPSHVLSVNHVLDASILDYMLGYGGETHFMTTTIDGCAFNPDLIIVEVDIGDDRLRILLYR